MANYEIVGGGGQLLDADGRELVAIMEQMDAYGDQVPEHIGAAFPLLFGRASASPNAATRQVAASAGSRLSNMLRNMMPTVRRIAAGPPVAEWNQPRVVPVAQGPVREVVQGLDSGAALIAAGAQAVITFPATMVYRPTRLMVGPDIAGLWVIDDLRVSADSLFLSAGAVPATAFLPDSVGASALKRRSAQPGTPISVLATNIDGAPHRFRGALFGEGSDTGSC